MTCITGSNGYTGSTTICPGTLVLSGSASAISGAVLTLGSGLLLSGSASTLNSAVAENVGAITLAGNGNSGTLVLASSASLSDDKSPNAYFLAHGGLLTVGTGATSIFACEPISTVASQTISPVPEPSTLVLLTIAAGMACCGLRRRG
ncbi:MAG: PEP-CTERM sorting domain-containing protein [Thermoguttaceae bacterium]